MYHIPGNDHRRFIATSSSPAHTAQQSQVDFRHPMQKRSQNEKVPSRVQRRPLTANIDKKHIRRSTERDVERIRNTIYDKNIPPKKMYSLYLRFLRLAFPAFPALPFPLRATGAGTDLMASLFRAPFDLNPSGGVADAAVTTGGSTADAPPAAATTASYPNLRRTNNVCAVVTILFVNM